MPVMLVRRLAALTLLVAAPAVAQSAVSSGPIDSARFAPALGIDLSRVERVTPDLYRRDLVLGAGAVLRTGATVTLRIRSARSDGTPINVSDAPITVAWYPGLFVRGVEVGVGGMRVGGRRQLLLGPGAGGAMPTDAVVVVDVELLAAS